MYLKFQVLKQNKFLPFLFSVFFSLTGLAQVKKPDVASPETPKEIKFEKKQARKLYSVPQFWHETVLFVKQPTKWNGNDWLKVGAVTASTLAAMPFDERIAQSSQGNQRYNNSAAVQGGRMYGEWYSIIAVAGGVGVFGLLAHDTTAKKMSIELLQAGLYSEIITSVLKVAIGRARPEISEDPFVFKPFNLAYSYHSMPSGHTTSAFALSTVLSRHAHSTTLKILAYVPAGFTMFSRIYQNQHWLSDEIIGAAIGIFVAEWVVDLHEGKRHRINVTSISPIGISYTFNNIKEKR
jgi:membrane-associated phospholipid phosphatase